MPYSEDVERLRELHKFLPVELPSGEVVCGAHLLVICPYCCMDFSYMADEEGGGGYDGNESDDFDEESSDSDDSQWGFRLFPNMKPTYSHELRIGTGRVLPERFVPPDPNDSPRVLFPPGVSKRGIPWAHRYIRKTNMSEFLIYTDGACLNNGQADPRAGCSFVFRDSTETVTGHSQFPLEAKGPLNEEHQQTSNRAELRAVIGALRFRFWPGEGFDSLVIATDSEYVVEGATNWIKTWLRKDWKTNYGPVKNKDLWQALLGEFERWEDGGLKIKFWRIPREWNTEADCAAKAAAASNNRPPREFSKICSILV